MRGRRVLVAKYDYRPVNFFTLTEACRRRGEIAIGYVRQREGQSRDARSMGGVVVNPRKSEAVTFAEGDRLIVTARD